MKRLVLVFAMVLAGCNNPQVGPLDRYVDHQYNIVCYRYYEAISCVKVDKAEVEK